MISVRIKELAELVPLKKRIIDVGCDHALLDIYMALKHENIDFLATDISENAIKSAVRNIHENNLESRIKTLVTNGLEGIFLNPDDTIVISGMGTNTIIKILTPYLSDITDIVIQTNRDIEALRLFMFQNGFKIKNEKVIYDDRYYVFIHFVKGNIKYEDVDLWLGPIIKDSCNKDYFEFLLKKYKKILSGIPDNDLKRENIQKRVELLNQKM